MPSAKDANNSLNVCTIRELFVSLHIIYNIDIYN